MEKVEVTKDKARSIWKEAGHVGRETLNKLFGKDMFVEKITDRVKTFKDACDVLGIQPGGIASFGVMYPEGYRDTEAAVAHVQLSIIARALNEGWKPNWNDTNEKKWYPWFDMRSGVGFSDSRYGLWTAHSGAGSRLCFKSEELANYAGKQFEDIYKKLLTL